MLPSCSHSMAAASEPSTEAMTLFLVANNAERRISEQRVAGADRVDHPFGEAVDGEERPHVLIAFRIGAERQQAALAELEDERACISACR